MGGFMGMTWDATGVAFDPETWRQALRVLKPGGHLLAFGGTRTQHRMVCAIEDAGFEIRDTIANAVASDTAVRRFLASLDSEQQRAFVHCLEESQSPGMMAWVYGSGYPKSLDVAKAIGKAARGAPELAAQAQPWQGWGTALKPAFEPICMARKPLAKDLTVAANVLAHRTGALNIDGCRVGLQSTRRPVGKPLNGGAYGTDRSGRASAERIGGIACGRWPANLLHDGSDEVLAAFPQAPGQLADAKTQGEGKFGNVYGAMRYGRDDEPGAKSDTQSAVGGKIKPGTRRGDKGSAARFFWCPKTSATDRNDGVAGLQDRTPRANHHPTVKPTELMRYLCRLVTPPGGTVLDPFMGSGSTLKAAELEGFDAIGIELDPVYVEIARRRIASDAPLFSEVLG
jgi:site-specific DNA-methyltransferase (adenine-specific)